MLQFHFTGKNALADKMVVHLDVLCLGVKDRVLSQLDVGEVIAIDHCRIEYLHTDP